MDTLTLKSLQYHGKHGFYELERTEGNEFEVDLVFYADLHQSRTTDDLSQTIDYEKAEQIVRNIMNGPSVKLIETLANKIGDQLFDKFIIAQELEIRVRKLNPPLKTDTEYSQVTCRWSR